MNAERVENECNISLDDGRKARRNHRDFKPGFVDALFSRGAAYREWREKDRSLAAAIMLVKQNLRKLERDAGRASESYRMLREKWSS